MRLAILHYHLNRGGVTSVIRNQLAALALLDAERRPERVLIIHGGRAAAWEPLPEEVTRYIPVEVDVAPRLEYDNPSTEPQSPADLLSELASVLDRHDCVPHETLVHVHNHTLGKSAALPKVIDLLAQRGHPLLCQLHDFAEDFRGGNYRRLRSYWGDELDAVLYPQSARIGYAVLNGRDEGILSRAGVADDRLTRLPNPIDAPHALPDRDEAREKVGHIFGIPDETCLALYPVRGIRRKNIGELLLWGVLFGPEFGAADDDNAAPPLSVATTLPPMNRFEHDTYSQWEEFSGRHHLPVWFGVGNHPAVGFNENLAAADLLLTTSVAEGFGMVFLEGWLLGKRLVGRLLPEITRDFRSRGLDLAQLSERVAIPINLIDRDAWERRLLRDARSARESYSLPPLADDEVRAELDRMTETTPAGETLDFASLGSDMQRDLLRRLIDSPADRAAVRSANPWMTSSLTTPDSEADALIARNRDTVLEHYSLDAFGSRLAAVYDRLQEAPADSPVEPLADPGRVLSEFLRLPRLHPIRLE